MVAMFVKEIMKKKVISLKKHNTIADALSLLHKHHIRHIPIVDDDQHLIGIVSDRDIRDASPSILDSEINQALLDHTIDQIMSSPVVTTHPDELFEEVANIFYEKEFACVPVVHQKKLIGMVTEKDLLYAFIQLTGTQGPSTRLEIRVPDRVGILSDVSTFFSKRNIKIVSVYTYPTPQQSGFKILVFRIQTMNPMNVIHDIKQSKEFEVVTPMREDNE